MSVNVNTDVQHFSEQLELFFLFPPPTLKRFFNCPHFLRSVLPVSAHSSTALKRNYVLTQMLGFRNIFNCEKAMSEIFQKCDMFHFVYSSFLLF